MSLGFFYLQLFACFAAAAAPLAAAPPEPWNVWNSATPAPNPALAAGLGTSPGMLPPSSIGIRWTGWKVDGGGGAGGEEG